jgi:hypothetical protein
MIMMKKLPKISVIAMPCTSLRSRRAAAKPLRSHRRRRSKIMKATNNKQLKTHTLLLL